MTTDICTSSNPPYWAAPNFFDTEQIALRRFDPPSYIGVPRHFDPYNPEKCFSGWSTSKPGPPSPPSDPEYILWRDFARTYPGDITKYVPFDPENFDPESFFFGGSSPSSAEPSEFDPSDPKLHPQDPKLLDNGFDDQFPANYAPLTSENYHLYGFSQTYPGDYTKYTPFDPENFDPESFFFGAKFDPCDPGQDPKLLDASFDDQSPAKFDPCDPGKDPKLLDASFDDQSPAKFDPVDPEIGVWEDYSPSYLGDPDKYFPFDPENFDAENFFSFGGLPAKSEPCYPEIYPRDLKLLDDRFDDQSPDSKAKVDRSALVGENVGGCVEGNGEADKPVNTCDNKFVNNSKGKLTNVESSGTAANKWKKKESSSASKAAWNTPAEEETWGSVGEELGRKTGYFATKCSLGADGSKSGGHGSGSIGRALCTRMPWLENS